MNEKVDHRYISDAIDELVTLLGIKEDIPSEMVLNLFRSGSIDVSIERMASHLGLPIKVNIVTVPANHRQQDGSRFTTSALVKTDDTGKGTESITAQVSIPSYLPFYGSEILKGFPITVKVSDNCQKHPSAFLGIMAHELSHVILYSLLSPRKDNEVYTDLAGMVLGLSNLMKEGRKVVEVEHGRSSAVSTTTTYGYLSDEAFAFALDRVRTIRADKGTPRRQLLGRLRVYAELVSFCQRQLRAFGMFLEYLDKNVGRNIHKSDTLRIVELHQLDYVERLNIVLDRHQLEFKKIDTLCGELVHYTPGNLESLRGALKKTDASINELRREVQLLDSDVTVLKRNVGFFYRQKVKRLVGNGEEVIG
jgi:hypothetical protein